MEAVPASVPDYSISMSDPKEGETLVSSRHIKRRSKSFCGSPSSSSSGSLIDSPLSPVTPLQFSGVPFKWEKQPGVPKQQRQHTPKYKSPGRDLLPLPPAGASSSTTQRFINVWPKKKKTHSMTQRDPFVAALVECSKPTEEEEEVCWKSTSVSSSWSVTKVSRTLGDRFGIVDLYSSCKTSCSVMESKVLIPRSGRSSYDMLTRRIG